MAKVGLIGVFLGVWLSAFSATARAGDEALAGNWKVVRLGQEKETLWLIRLEAKDGKWSGAVLDKSSGIIPVKLDGLQIAGNRVFFTLKGDKQTFQFEGKVPNPASSPVRGSVEVGRTVFLAELEPTRLTTLGDPFEAGKELLARHPESPEAFDTAIELLRHATEKKASEKEVRGWADAALRGAAAFGSRWQREMAVRIAEALESQEAYAKLGVNYARMAAKALSPTDPPSAQVRVLEALAAGLRHAGQNGELKEVETNLAKLEAQADEEYRRSFPSVKPEPFAGRKGSGDRVVLMELFTGAQCPPCVAADLAFDALTKTYRPSEAVLLQYHRNIPGPDPLANPDADARAAYYGSAAEGTPVTFFNGKPGAPGGGPAAEAAAKYQDYRRLIDPLLETPARVKLKAVATHKDNRVEVRAEASGLDEKAQHLRLRFALVEQEVRYQGPNRVRFHHHVVRGMPGGPAGLALKGKADQHTVLMNLDNLRKDLNQYLDGVAKEQPFPDSKRPLAFKDLSVIALVQDDATKEVLQVIQVPVKAE